MTNCDIDYDQYRCSDCTKSLCLEIFKIYLEKCYNLVKTLNMNDDDMEKCCGVSTDFIRKLTDFLFILIGEKASINIPLRKMNRLRKSATLTCIYGPMYLQLDDYPPYSDKISDIFETHINSN